MADTAEEQALLKLRKDMLQFIVDELALRAMTDENFTLSRRVTDLLKEQIDASLSKATITIQRADAAAIAAQIRDAERDGGKANEAIYDRSSPDPEEKESDPDITKTAWYDGVIRRKQAAAPAQSQAGKDEGEPRAPLPTVVKIALGVLGAALLALAALYAIQWNALHQANGASAEQTRQLQALEASRATECKQKKELADQVSVLVDSPGYKNYCAEGRPGREANPLCVSATELRRRAAAAQCRTR